MKKKKTLGMFRYHQGFPSSSSCVCVSFDIRFELETLELNKKDQLVRREEIRDC